MVFENTILVEIQFNKVFNSELNFIYLKSDLHTAFGEQHKSLKEF